MPSVENITFWSLLRRLLFRHFVCSLGLIKQIINKKGNVNPKRNIAKGAVISEKAFVGVLMTMASNSPSMIA